MEDQQRGQALRLPDTGQSSNTPQPFNPNDIPGLLTDATASMYGNYSMQQAPTILNFHSSSLPPSIRPSATRAIPSFILSAQQYRPPTQHTSINNISQHTILPHPDHPFFPPPPPQRQQTQNTSLLQPCHPFLPPSPPSQQPDFPATGFKQHTIPEAFLDDLDASVPDIKACVDGATNEASTTLAEIYPRVLQIFTKGFDQIRDIIASGENIRSVDEALCAQFMADDAIEGIKPYKGPGTNQEAFGSWKVEYDQYQREKSESQDRAIGVADRLTLPLLPSPVPYHIHARNPLWQINTLHSLQALRVTIIQNLRIIRNSMDLPVKGKDVFPLPEMGFGDAKRSFGDRENEHWAKWDTFMGGLGFLTCMKEEMEHWTKLWEAFNVEVEVAKRAAERKKTLGRLWGASGEEIGMGETGNAAGMRTFEY